MGKNNKHKKFLKSEKAKVKLKGGKKLLTKGQNITDTSFKVKKIMIQSQLTQQPENEPVTRKNLNLKDLSSRCSHHNTNMRVEALNGLTELASTHAQTLVQNLCTFVRKCASMCIDKESAVRKEAHKLLNVILGSVNPKQLEPFLSELVSYLTVGLSHLYRDIQEDSLFMMDAILNAAPSLVARAAPKLLPAFLDQISIRKNSVVPERALSINLQSANTSTRWRIKVLGRLHALLMASSELAFKSEVTNRQQGLRLVNYDQLCIPISPYSWDEPCVIQGLFSTGAAALVEQDLFSDSKQMKSYIEVLMPLLFETWVEVGPSSKLQKDAGNLITVEAAELLECILEIMQLIFKYLENAQEEENIKWFRNTYRDSYLKHILAHFPYIQKDGFTPDKSPRNNGQPTFREEKVKKCGDQNLAVCLMACIFCNKPTLEQAQLITEHTKKHLDSNRSVNERLVNVLEVVLLERADYWATIGHRIEPLVNSLVTACLRHSPDFSKSALFNMLCDLSIKSVTSRSNNHGIDLIYERFIQQLPLVLTKEDVPSKAMKTISTLVSALHVGILVSLRTNLTPIVANLSKVCVSGSSQMETQTRIIYLLFSASVWRADILDAVGRQLVNCTEHRPLLLYYIELLEHWRLSHPDNAVALKLTAMPWLMNQDFKQCVS